MNHPQKVQLIRAKGDAIMDIASIAVFSAVVYFAANPDKYNRLTGAIDKRINAVFHKLSVWQTKVSIRSLPETDDV